MDRLPLGGQFMYGMHCPTPDHGPPHAVTQHEHRAGSGVGQFLPALLGQFYTGVNSGRNGWTMCRRATAKEWSKPAQRTKRLCTFSAEV